MEMKRSSGKWIDRQIDGHTVAECRIETEIEWQGENEENRR